MDLKNLVVVSNRLPVVLKKEKQRWSVTTGEGGLVTALGPVLRQHKGLWLGWSGNPGRTSQKLLDEAGQTAGYNLGSVELTATDVEKYYHGFSNEILWPLFHDMPGRCVFKPSYWQTYDRVNRKFARKIVDTTGPDDLVWVQDYHLLLVADHLRKMGEVRRTAFFLHIPFPPLDIFLKIPWRVEILRAMVKFDQLGFQTVRDRRNFIQCLRTLMPTVRPCGRGQVCEVMTPNKNLRVGAFPISIDFKQFASDAASQKVSDKAWNIHAELPDRKLILGVDRLDYSKGIPHRFYALERALDAHPELLGKVTFIQVVVPSREDVPEYHALKDEIEGMVGRINGRFTVPGWTPIHYIYRSLDRDELLAFYRTSEVALVTPLKDGMNLVAKEYCAANIEENGVLILSEFAGAAAQLHHGALLVNPHDVDGTADAIFQALTMPVKERKARMKRLRRSIRKLDVYHWVNSFLVAAVADDLKNVPTMEFFTPMGQNPEGLKNRP
jgi:trehalose 6-phosphate synthase/phosphatase